MRLGIDLTCWINERGYGRYTRELTRALLPLLPEHEVVGFADPWTAEALDLEAPNLRVTRVAQSAAPTRAAASSGSRSPFDMLRLTRAVRRERLDAFLSPSVYSYFPLPPGLPAAVVIHDAIAERFPELTLPGRRARLFWKAKVRLALWQARLVLTVSDFSAGELSARLGVAGERLRVTLEAPAPGYRPSGSAEEIERAAAAVGLGPGARWLTYVGGFNPHKRVDDLVRAHAALVERHAGEPPHLLLVGARDGDVFHQGVEAIRTAIDDSGTAELVHWTGFLPDEHLRHLHSGAVALVLPSDCEGFGLPAVEAAACGSPVVATTESPLPELLEGGGLFVRPRDLGALTEALSSLLEDEARRRRMGARARERAGRLSWEASARIVANALGELSARAPGPASAAGGG